MTGAWLGQEISGPDIKLLCRNKISWGCVATEYIMSRQILAKTKGSLVTTKYFYVVIELALPEVFYRDIMFLCHDRVGNGGEAFYSNIIFYVATKCFMA